MVYCPTSILLIYFIEKLNLYKKHKKYKTKMINLNVKINYLDKNAVNPSQTLINLIDTVAILVRKKKF